VAQTEIQRYIKALRHPDINVRREAARTLGDMGPGAKEAVPELIEALKGEDVDLIAVWALGQIGAAARAAVPAITQWLKKADSSCCCNIRGQLAYLPEDERRRLIGTCHSSK